MQAKSYELQQFHKRFFIYGGIAYLVYVVFAALVLWLRGWQLWVTLLLGCLLLGSAYVAGRRSIGTMSRELRAIVDIMNQILEAPEQVPAEPYKQGELGELYTNLYKLVQALKESNRKEQEEKIFLRDIMSDISHQLKTPLASLTVFLDLLYDGRVPDVDKQKQMLLESKNQVSRMEWMVLSMLKLARIEAGAIQFEVRENIEKFDSYKDSFENYKDIEDRVIGGITFRGRTYERIGYEWIQYIAQLDDSRALSIGLRNLDCVPGTMPDIILSNMSFR